MVISTYLHTALVAKCARLRTCATIADFPSRKKACPDAVRRRDTAHSGMVLVFKMLDAAASAAKASVAVAGAMAATMSAPMPAGTGGPCDLVGDWVPCRVDEWRNRNIGSHKARARAAHTKVTYDVQGRGHGRVGELFVQYSVSTIAPGRFTAVAKVPSLLWSASDGSLTLHHDGTLEVQYPSNGIVEYWRRCAAGSLHLLSGAAVQPSGPARSLKLVIRHIDLGSSITDLGWHWGLAIGREDACFEVAGSIAVVGPRGLVAASSPFATKTKPTHVSQYDAVLSLPQTTHKSDREIEEFARHWVRQHPVYGVLGPNCQTFADDLFAFLCGQNLPFAKSASRLDTSGHGPENHPSTQWLKPEKRPR